MMRDTVILMMRDTVILSIFFGTAGGLVYDGIYKNEVTKKVYKQILLGIETPFKDIWDGAKTVMSDVYNNSPSKGTIGELISTPAQAAWTAAKTVMSALYDNSPSKDAIGKLISTSAQAAWDAAQTVVSGTYLGVKTPYIDGYKGVKYVLSDILGEQSNLNGLGAWAVVAGLLSLYSTATTPLLLMSFAAGVITKSLTEYNINPLISLSNKGVLSSK